MDLITEERMIDTAADLIQELLDVPLFRGDAPHWCYEERVKKYKKFIDAVRAYLQLKRVFKRKGEQ